MQVPLPPDYRWREIAAFHARDPLALAESVQDARLRKGLLLGNRAVVLDIEIRPDVAVVHSDMPEAETLAAGMLGLHVDPGPFERAFGDDPALGPLLRQRPGLRIAQTATPFEALTWAVIGQQIHLAFAIALRRALITTAGRQHPDGLWCYPGPAQVARLDPEQLTAQKFSRAKAEALVHIAREADAGRLPLEEWHDRPGPEIVERLLSLRGVGPWTANYVLLRGFSHPDCSLHGDAAVRNALQRAFGPDKPDSARAERLLERYRPYRSLAAAHFWASLSKEA